MEPSSSFEDISYNAVAGLICKQARYRFEAEIFVVGI